MYLLIDEKDRKYLVKGDKDVHTNYGVIVASKLCEENVGLVIESHQCHKYKLIKPNILDYMEKAKRGPQAMTPKDCAMISTFSGIGPGSKVLEAGVGSGVLSMYLANLVSPATLTSYEIREDFAKIALGNFEKFGITNVEIKMKNIYEGIDEKDLDLVSLDVPEPWRAIEPAKGALHIGGYISSYSPSIEQNKKFCDALGDCFTHETLETIQRDWDMEVVRPFSRMIAHTGFITIARLVNR
jgi:tRNA (adenine57-N1/adenine58-N1)-methyltransferase